MSLQRPTPRPAIQRPPAPGAARPTARFQWQKRDPTEVQRKANQRGDGLRDGFLIDAVRAFTATVGNNQIRILPIPPTWEGARDFALEIWVHYGVGADRSVYLCTEQMATNSEPLLAVPNQACAICEERRLSESRGEHEYADALRPSLRHALYVLNRKDPQAGATIWVCPHRVYKQICNLSQDPVNNGVLPVEDPETGNDLFFTREGSDIKTQYINFQFAHAKTPLDHEAALKFISDHPLPTVLKWYDYDHVLRALGGQVPDETEAEVAGAPDAGGDGAFEHQATYGTDDAPGAEAAAPDEAGADLDWDSIHRMDRAELDDLLAAYTDLRVDAARYQTDQALADAICIAAQIPNPNPPTTPRVMVRPMRGNGAAAPARPAPTTGTSAVKKNAAALAQRFGKNA